MQPTGEDNRPELSGTPLSRLLDELAECYGDEPTAPRTHTPYADAIRLVDAYIAFYTSLPENNPTVALYRGLMLPAWVAAKETLAGNSVEMDIWSLFTMESLDMQSQANRTGDIQLGRQAQGLAGLARALEQE